jgi:RNAse (barnase) inhibitor barstar
MSDNSHAHDAGVANDLFGRLPGNLFQQAMLMREPGNHEISRAPRNGTFADEGNMSLFKTVRSNIVQSIRAFRVPDLADEANRLGQHFLYANCACALTKGEVLETIATSFLFPKHFGKNYDALYDCLTDLVHKAGPQPGFVIVLEALPATQKFDKDARETLLDVFREAAEFWAERKIAFRVFYSFV